MSYVFPTLSTTSASSREPVVAATTTAQTLSTDFENGDTIDGVTLATGDRILIKDQASGIENGIYEVQATGAPIRTPDFYIGAFAAGISITVTEGTVNDDTLWLCTTDPPNDVIGTDALAFVRSGGEGANGDMSGPASSTANTIPRFADTGGKTLTTTGIAIDGSDNLSGVVSLVLEAGTNDVTVSATSQTVGAPTLNIPDLTGTSGDLVISNASQTLTNKTLTSPIISTISNTGTLTLPTSTDTLVGRATTDTLTNKTLTLPVISSISNSGTITLPTGTDTLVARATSDTLTNKTMNASNNTFTNFLHGTQVDNPSSGVHGVTGTIVGTSDTQTLTNKTLTSPRIGTSILDTNGNELLLLTATGSAVNELTLANAAAGFDPTLSSTGTDTDIGIALETKGAGAVSIGSASATDSGILEIFDDTGGESASITVPTAITTGYTLTLPDGVGSSGQFLRTDGNNPATLTWVTPGGGGDVSGPGSSTDNAVVRWNGTSGTAVQDSGHTIGDNGDYVLSGSAAYIELPDITAPSNPGAGLGRLYKKTGNDGIFWLPDGAGPEVDLTAGSAAALSAVLAVGNTTGGNDIVMSGASDTLNFTRTNNLILDAATIATADRTVTFPDPGGADNVVYEALAQTLTNKTLTAPTLNAVPTFSLDDTDSAFNLVIQSTSTITTADKTLTLDVNDANRTIGLGGNITTAGDFTTSGAFALTLTQTGATNVTLPTTGTLATLAGTETFTNKTITSPIINQITTDGTEEVLIFADGGTAVNEFTMTNAATGVDPMLSATGGDANIGIALETKGTGTVTIGSASATDSGILEIFDDTGGESASITVPTAITTAYTLALPDGVGSSGQFLSTDGNNPATLTWASGGGGDTVDTVTTTDATTTTISTIATSSDTTYFLSAKLVARRTDSGSESAGYKLMATYRNNGGTLSQVSSDDLLSQEDSAQWNVDTTISGTNIIIEVTGQSSKTINWKSSWNTTDV